MGGGLGLGRRGSAAASIEYFFRGGPGVFIWFGGGGSGAEVNLRLGLVSTSHIIRFHGVHHATSFILAVVAGYCLSMWISQD